MARGTKCLHICIVWQIAESMPWFLGCLCVFSVWQISCLHMIRRLGWRDILWPWDCDYDVTGDKMQNRSSLYLGLGIRVLRWIQIKAIGAPSDWGSHQPGICLSKAGAVHTTEPIIFTWSHCRLDVKDSMQCKFHEQINIEKFFDLTKDYNLWFYLECSPEKVQWSCEHCFDAASGIVYHLPRPSCGK